jgi:hypothetical protein
MLVAASVMPVLAQTTIDTRTGPVNTNWESGWTVVGQIFTAPTDNFMQTASLWFGSNSSAAFTGVLQEWAPSGLVGPRLYESALQTVTGVGPTRYDFNLGGVGLAPGTTYAFFADAPADQILGYNTANSDSYGGGNAMYGDLTTQYEWVYDQSFVGTFTGEVTAAPEPASLTLLATGLVGILGVARRRRSRHQ